MAQQAFDEIGRLPLPGDNVAIATRRLEAGTHVIYRGSRLTLDYTVLEGHRFAVEPIAAGAALLSWGLPFGVAVGDIEAGGYVCNAGMLEALRGRRLHLSLPAEPNFADRIVPYRLNEEDFRPSEQVPPYDEPRTFLGYRRGGDRGVGTRNYVVLLGTTSRTGSYVRALEARLKDLAAAYNIDGVVAVAHTEGGGDERPNNLDLLLRTLAGFMVHPNVGAVLAADYGTGVLTNAMLRRYMEEHGYPLGDLRHEFLTLRESFAANLVEGEQIVKGWLDEVSRAPRTEEPASHLKIALQCGGSDAFSGISGNPLASWVAREIIRCGGAANLAETDELIGAEPYVLGKVRDVETARRFLYMIERFKERAAWHGSSAEGNPSGGNKLRGLYNIVLKSIGAAMKRHPDVRLDYAIDYAERMQRPGYYFMDSPGNDLESIAGQVASGANMIFFITGNGSITNFPFVPTLKIVTTTRRHELLKDEMDVNAGAYLDGTPMDALGKEMLSLTLEVASGRRSAGERAGHAQVQIWRDWRQTSAGEIERLLHQPQPKGVPLKIKTEPAPVPEPRSRLQVPVPEPQSRLRVPACARKGMPEPRSRLRVNESWSFKAVRTPHGHSTDQVGLILPTSLCSGQIARLAAEALNRKGLGRDQGLSRFVALVHTEGCGVSGGPAEDLYARTMLGYLAHPLVKHALLLEHGCEKTHNDYMRGRLEAMGFDIERVGWASIQLNGGIAKVMERIEAYFSDALASAEPPAYITVGMEGLRLGLLGSGRVPDAVARSLAQLTGTVVGAGGTVVLPDGVSLTSSPIFLEEVGLNRPPEPSLAYGQAALKPGFHVMEAPTKHWVETLTGLGATGVEIVLAFANDAPVQGHPMIPLLRIGDERTLFAEDLDLLLEGDPSKWAKTVLERLMDVATHRYAPKLYEGNTDFQLTRGLLGVSL
jgi:altronate dehydratase